MATAVEVTAALKTAARSSEDALDGVEDALADRDALDDALDTATQEARNALAGRSLRAVDEAPYTLLFPQGIAYYTAAPLNAQTQRYGELRERAAQHLPADDAVRSALLPALDQGLAGWREAVTALDTARASASLAASALDQATDAWTRQMERTYGALVAELGKVAARRFFPRARNTGKAQETPEPTPEK